jgi:hypothetical protein
LPLTVGEAPGADDRGPEMVTQSFAERSEARFVVTPGSKIPLRGHGGRARRLHVVVAAHTSSTYPAFCSKLVIGMQQTTNNKQQSSSHELSAEAGGVLQGLAMAL